MPPALSAFLKRILLPVVVLLIVMTGIGLLITKVAEHVWPFTVEDSINRGFAANRDGFWNGVTAFWSFVGSTPCIIGVCIIVAAILRLTLHRWRESLFLCGAVSAQAIVFFFTTLAIDRARPKVHHLDVSPPTSSFPSGHTSAAFTLYVGMALVFSLLVQQTWAKTLCWLLILVPIAVATSRLYRGMHHPSDVTASFFNGTMCIWIMSRAILDRTVEWGQAHLPRKLQPAAA
jgi:membrane-associated phospholipid phosphatase